MVKILQLNWYFSITITVMEDNPESKLYGKHIRMQWMLIFNLVLKFVGITSPLYTFELVPISLPLEFRLRFGGNVIFLYYIPYREMINCSHGPLKVQKTFPAKSESLAQRSQTKVLPWMGRVCGFKTLIMCIVSSNWLDTNVG